MLESGGGGEGEDGSDGKWVWVEGGELGVGSEVGFEIDDV